MKNVKKVCEKPCRMPTHLMPVAGACHTWIRRIGVPADWRRSICGHQKQFLTTIVYFFTFNRFPNPLASWEVKTLFKSLTSALYYLSQHCEMNECTGNSKYLGNSTPQFNSTSSVIAHEILDFSKFFFLIWKVWN